MKLNPQLRTQDSVILPMILVCQGAEYKAVRRGLSRASGTPSVLSIPMGKSTSIYLQNCQWQHILNHPQPRVLVMGLCGSLKARYKVGDIVLYQDCVYQADSTPLVKPCDSTFIKQYHHLQDKVSIVKALTSDRIICSATEKRHLGEMTGADVVDMESFAVLEFFSQAGVAVAMLRVVSDDCYHDLPNLTAALSPEGVLQPLPLAMAMLRQPIAATRLIRGSLRGLQVLQQVTTRLFSS